MTSKDDVQSAGEADASERADDRPVVAALELVSLIQLGTEYWLRADGVRQLPPGDLFTDAGVLILGSMRLSGRAAIASFFTQRENAQRASGRITRHVASNHLATVLGPNRARVRSTVLVFSGEGDLPLPSSAPSGVADFDDICVQMPSGEWLFEQRLARTVFIGAGAPSFAR